MDITDILSIIAQILISFIFYIFIYLFLYFILYYFKYLLLFVHIHDVTLYTAAGMGFYALYCDNISFI